jgi:methanogenic corrinoid protein MtbC1
LRQQLLERQAWGDLGDLPCTGEIDPAQWSVTINDGSTIKPSSLALFIEADVVPGLVLAHRGPPRGGQGGQELAAETIEEFTTLVLAEETPVLSSFIEGLHLRGASYELLYLGLLSATARRLGEFWEADIVDFGSVTIALWRLQELLRNFSPAFQNEGSKPSNGLRALLLSTPGEQHNFGLAMLGEFLFREGWSIAGGPGLKPDEIRKLVRTQFFSMVGLTLSGERGIESLTATIRMIREASCNRGIVIMVGGALFNSNPELVGKVGADSTATDARQGALQARLLINNLGSGH